MEVTLELYLISVMPLQIGYTAFDLRVLPSGDAIFFSAVPALPGPRRSREDYEATAYCLDHCSVLSNTELRSPTCNHDVHFDFLFSGVRSMLPIIRYTPSGLLLSSVWQSSAFSQTGTTLEKLRYRLNCHVSRTGTEISALQGRNEAAEVTSSPHTRAAALNAAGGRFELRIRYRKRLPYHHFIAGSCNLFCDNTVRAACAGYDRVTCTHQTRYEVIKELGESESPECWRALSCGC